MLELLLVKFQAIQTILVQLEIIAEHDDELSETLTDPAHLQQDQDQQEVLLQELVRIEAVLGQQHHVVALQEEGNDNQKTYINEKNILFRSILILNFNDSTRY